jgi:hypothetical protein
MGLEGYPFCIGFRPVLYQSRNGLYEPVFCFSGPTTGFHGCVRDQPVVCMGLPSNTMGLSLLCMGLPLACKNLPLAGMNQLLTDG